MAMKSQNGQLRAAREEKNLTQQELADKLGVTKLTIGRWERGTTHPTAYYRRKLCELFQQTDHELGLLISVESLAAIDVAPLSPANTQVAISQEMSREESKQSPFPPIWHVPYRRNLFFTGREAILQRLHEGFYRENPPAQALSGLGGIGKTQTALEYCFRYSDAYQAIFWVRADSRETLLVDIVAIAGALDLPEKDLQDQNSISGAVKQWLRSHQRWLLILDNIEDLELVDACIPLVHQGSVLLTTRTHITIPVAQPIDMDIMEADEGALFLLKRAKIIAHGEALSQASEHDALAAKVLSHMMDGLPLALDQAGAYILETACGVSRYHDLYHQGQADLLNRRGRFSSGHPESVAATFSLIFKTMSQLNNTALDLLRLCAFLHPDEIPVEMITTGAMDLPLSLQEAVSTPLAFNDVISVLSTFSLIRRNAQQNFLSLHRMVQIVLKKMMDTATHQRWAEAAVRVVNSVLPDDSENITGVELSHWSHCHQYLPHAHICKALIEELDMYFPEALRLLNQVGKYLYESGHYAEAEVFFHCALKICETHFETEHLETVRCLHNIAIVYWDQGRYPEAASFMQRAVSTRQHYLGTGHPDTICSRYYLGIIYAYQGIYNEAEQLLLQAFVFYGESDTTRASHEKRPSRYTANYITVLSDLGWLHHAQKRYPEAEQYLLRALSECEHYLGSQSVVMTFILSNLGMVYRDQGNLVQAEFFLQRGLTLDTQLLGQHHPGIGRSLEKLGKLYYLQGRYAEAEEHLIKALTILEQHLQPQHLYITDTLHDLGVLYHQQGKFTEVEALYQRMLEQLGSGHPSFADVLKKYAALLRETDREGAAMVLELQIQHLPQTSC